MGQFSDEIPGFLLSWIEKQQMFWTATAPLSGTGHVNVSPKCTRGTFHIVNSRKVWYEDMSGSGVETISHLKEPGNGRITILFCAFEGPPRICRLFGIGTVYEFGSPEYNEYISPETRVPGSRAVIMIDVHKVGTSCGYAIPFYDFKSHRNQLLQWAQRKEVADDHSLLQVAKSNGNKSESADSKGLRMFWKKENSQSIDGIPGLNSMTFETFGQVFDTGKLVYSSDGIGSKAIASGVSASSRSGIGLLRILGTIELLDSRFLAGFSLGVAATLVAIHLVGL